MKKNVIFYFSIFIFCLTFLSVNALAEDMTSEEILGNTILDTLEAEECGKDITYIHTEDYPSFISYYPEFPLTITDSSGKSLTLYKPAEKAIVLNSDAAEAFSILSSEEKVAGVGSTIKSNPKRYANFIEKQDVGRWNEPDIETIVSLHPDLILSYVGRPDSQVLEDKLPLNNIPVVRLDFYHDDTLNEEISTLGKILDRVNESEKYINWRNGVINDVRQRVSEVPQSKRPTVYIEGDSGNIVGRSAYGLNSGLGKLCEIAGGANIAEGVIDEYGTIETEWIIKEDPQYVIILSRSSEAGYESSDSRKLAEIYSDFISLPGIKTVDAVRDNHVYVISNSYALGPSDPAAIVQIASWFYPELFTDISPEDVHQEYLSLFGNIDYNVSSDGSFFYPYSKDTKI